MKHCCLKACLDRNKCFQNIKVDLELTQSYLIYIAHTHTHTHTCARVCVCVCVCVWVCACKFMYSALSLIRTLRGNLNLFGL